MKDVEKTILRVEGNAGDEALTLRARAQPHRQ